MENKKVKTIKFEDMDNHKTGKSTDIVILDDLESSPLTNEQRAMYRKIVDTYGGIGTITGRLSNQSPEIQYIDPIYNNQLIDNLESFIGMDFSQAEESVISYYNVNKEELNTMYETIEYDYIPDPTQPWLPIRPKYQRYNQHVNQDVVRNIKRLRKRKLNKINRKRARK